MPTSQEISGYISQNLNDPNAIAQGMQQHGVGFSQIMQATGYSPSQVASYVGQSGNPFLQSQWQGFNAPTSGGTGPSNRDISNYVNSNLNDPGAIARGMQQYGVGLGQISQATGYNTGQIGDYIRQSGNGYLSDQFRQYNAPNAMGAAMGGAVGQPGQLGQALMQRFNLQPGQSQQAAYGGQQSSMLGQLGQQSAPPGGGLLGIGQRPGGWQGDSGPRYGGTPGMNQGGPAPGLSGFNPFNGGSMYGGQQRYGGIPGNQGYGGGQGFGQGGQQYGGQQNPFNAGSMYGGIQGGYGGGQGFRGQQFGRYGAGGYGGGGQGYGQGGYGQRYATY